MTISSETPLHWDPERYEKFSGPRLQPGIDLMARMAPPSEGAIVDLGCGTGALTVLLGERFGADRVSGLDSSPEMIAKARERHPDLSWQETNIAGWHADQPLAAIFSNAALHWLPTHERLFPLLLDELVPGGVLAIQMPRPYQQPSFRLLVELIRQPEWRDLVPEPSQPVSPPEEYFDLLSPIAASVEIWQTEYLQVLDPPDAVFEYARSTMLLPIVEGLAEADAARFSDAYRSVLAEAYGSLHQGKTLYPFNRLFILARK